MPWYHRAADHPIPPLSFFGARLGRGFRYPERRGALLANRCLTRYIGVNGSILRCMRIGDLREYSPQLPERNRISRFRGWRALHARATDGPVSKRPLALVGDSA